MKTERRHELQTNELADWIGSHAEMVKPYLKTIIGAAVVGVVALFAIAAMRGQKQGEIQSSWTEYFAAVELNDLAGLREIASRYPNTEAGAWAMQSVGDIEAATGARSLFIDRNDARERLLLATEAYSDVLNRSQEPILLQRAHMGLAQVYESLGEFDNATKEYEAVADKWPNSALAKESLDRKRFLDNPSTIQFSEWLAKYEPPKREAIDQVLQEGAAGIKPPSPSDDLPNLPELSLPGADELDRPGEMDLEPPSKSAEPAADEPAENGGSEEAPADAGDE